MLRDITLYEFNSLNDNEKHEAIMEWAVNVGDRNECDYGILLYQFDNFYVEVYYNDKANAIERFKAFVSQELLTPYLNQMIYKNWKTRDGINALLNILVICLMLEIEKDIKEDNYFIRTPDYKYVFDWNTMLELRIKFKDYAHREIDSWYEDLDMFMRRKIRRVKAN